MKKHLNETSIANELKNGSRFFSQPVEDDIPVEQPKNKNANNGDIGIPVEPEPTMRSAKRLASQSTSESTARLTNLSTSESTQQSTTQSTNRSTEESTTISTGETTTNRYDESPILGRPKSFYISHQQDKDLDLAVAKLASGQYGPQIQRIDRSSLLRLILEAMDITSEQTLQRLHQHHVDRQLYQLNSRQPGRQIS